MAITKLKDTNGDQVQKLLEANGIRIVKATSKRFDIGCPDCDKNEAFIDYSGKHRYIKCNRENECGYNIGMWEFIANKQSIDPKDNKKMLEYINYVIGQVSITHSKKDIEVDAVAEIPKEHQEFLVHCNEILTLRKTSKMR